MELACGVAATALAVALIVTACGSSPGLGAQTQTQLVPVPVLQTRPGPEGTPQLLPVAPTHPLPVSPTRPLPVAPTRLAPDSTPQLLPVAPTQPLPVLQTRPGPEGTPQTQGTPQPVPVAQQRPDRVLVGPSTDPDAHPCERQRDSDDGLLGICTADGVRYCFDGGWSLCPGGGQPCPPLPEGDPLAFTGRGWPSPGSAPTVPLTAGPWRVEVCLADSPYGESGFTVALLDSEGWPVARVGDDWTFALVWVRGPAGGEPGVADGWWSVDFDVLPAALRRPAQLHVTAEAGGAWTAAFTRLPGSVGSR